MHFAAKRTKSREKYGLFHRKVVKSTFDSEVSFSHCQTPARIDYLRASRWLVAKNLDFCVKTMLNILQSAEYLTDLGPNLAKRTRNFSLNRPSATKKNLSAQRKNKTKHKR